MKKRNSFFIALILCFGLLVQPSSTMAYVQRARECESFIVTLMAVPLGVITLVVGVGGVNMIVEKTVGLLPTVTVTSAGLIAATAILFNVMLKNAKESEVKYEGLTKKFAGIDFKQLIKTDFPEQIDQRIEALINQTISFDQESEKVSIEIFPTPKSKIFVLQNIEDFFTFNPEHKVLNQFVHEACMKKINALEKLSSEPVDVKIDEARNNYMKEYGISVQTLKDMSSNDLESIINKVQNDFSSVMYNISQSQIKNDEKDENNIKFSALLSILGHLSYKKAENKSEIFEGKELIKKMKAVKAKEKCVQKAQEKTTSYEKPQGIIQRMQAWLNSWWSRKK